MHTHAIRLYEYGGPDVLRWERVTLQPPGPGELLIRNTAVGINFADIQYRKGMFHSGPPLPASPGLEASGIVESIGAHVEDFAPGDRVGCFEPPFGAYAEQRLYPAARTVKLPPEVDDAVAAATLLKGVTAYCLLHLAYPVKRGDVALVHDAAGGVGVLMSQWAASLGATVIGTTSSDEKAAVAKRNGCAHVIVRSSEDIVSQVKEITGGRMASVVYDPVGKDTFLSSLDCLRRRGTMVSYGSKSGPVPPIDPLLLMRKGSLMFTRTTNTDFTTTREELSGAAAGLFGALASGVLRPAIHGTYALRDAARAHSDFEARKTIGSIVLKV